MLFSPISQILFATLLAVSLALFAAGVYLRCRLILLGRPESRFDRIGSRVRGALLYAFGQKKVLSSPFGLNHFAIFWSFIVLLIANGAFILEGVFPGFNVLALLPPLLHYPLLSGIDLLSLLALLCVSASLLRRVVLRPACLDSAYVKGRSFEAFFILCCIALLMLAYFGLHGSLIAAGLEAAPSAMPVSSLAASLLEASPLAGSLASVAFGFWWAHAVVLLAFTCFLPFGKHMHIVSAIPNCFFRNLELPALPRREVFMKGNSHGAGQVDDFSWKDLLDSFSCTECGRCQQSCPAQSTGKALNPRQVIHAIKTNLISNGADLRMGDLPGSPLIGAEGEGTVTEEAIWACTTCGACHEKCPVLIEHMPKIIEMRRHLVQMEARFPEELLTFFENMEGRSNPWGIAPSERGKWATQLQAKPFAQGETEYLFYVGCAGAFDSRQKQVSVAFATILNAAGISWGMLGREELCCGDSLRRLGNEFVFEKMARENVALFREKGITKIVTPCPHCFSTLKNDYRQFGIELEVKHHSEFIEELLASGRLKPTREVSELGRLVFHDSCYLGRHNDVYDAPRRALETVTGSPVLEMQRSREGSACCGAGGGRMWMEEQTGLRINRERVSEALREKPDTVCVACPYCLTMLEDGVKDLQGTRSTQVKDIAEIVAQGLRRV